jgi:hypothetical protein
VPLRANVALSSVSQSFSFFQSTNISSGKITISCCKEKKKKKRTGAMGEVRAQCSEGGESVLGSESLTATDTAIVLLSAAAARGDLSKVAQYWLLVPQNAQASGMGEEIQQNSL